MTLTCTNQTSLMNTCNSVCPLSTFDPSQSPLWKVLPILLPSLYCWPTFFLISFFSYHLIRIAPFVMFQRELVEPHLCCELTETCGLLTTTRLVLEPLRRPGQPQTLRRQETPAHKTLVEKHRYLNSNLMALRVWVKWTESPMSTMSGKIKCQFQGHLTSHCEGH